MVITTLSIHINHFNHIERASLLLVFLFSTVNPLLNLNIILLINLSNYVWLPSLSEFWASLWQMVLVWDQQHWVQRVKPNDFGHIENPFSLFIPHIKARIRPDHCLDFIPTFEWHCKDMHHNVIMSMMGVKRLAEYGA